ncbi:MAG: MBOAT family O-acyltransferase [Clostridiales bacterium]
MVFSSLLFLFIFLPLVLVIYYILPKKTRIGFLFLANLIFYGWGEPVFVLVMIFSIIVNYVFGLLMEKYREKAKLFLVFAIIINLGLLGFFKYADFFKATLESVLGFSLGNAPLIPLPIGISFYTFQALAYIIDIYRKEIEAQRNIIYFGTYISFFPQLIAGPIVRYQEIAHDLIFRQENLTDFNDGVRLFIMGLAKKVLIANAMGLLWGNLQTTAFNDGVVAAWCGIMAFSLQIYFDFSGYSDMARGLGKMFGFHFPINFNYPYAATSITDFWRRWHITLSSWFRDYLYIPLGGSRGTILRTIINLFIVWSLTGLWHGASYNFILWGIYYFAILTAEKFIWGKLLSLCPKPLKHLYAVLLILFGWVIFALGDLTSIGNYFTAMFSLSNGFLQGNSLNYILSYLPLMAVGIFAALPIGSNIWQKYQSKKVFIYAENILLLGIFILSVAALVNQSYNPFLYFRF